MKNNWTDANETLVCRRIPECLVDEAGIRLTDRQTDRDAISSFLFLVGPQTSSDVSLLSVLLLLFQNAHLESYFTATFDIS